MFETSFISFFEKQSTLEMNKNEAKIEKYDKFSEVYTEEFKIT